MIESATDILLVVFGTFLVTWAVLTPGAPLMAAIIGGFIWGLGAGRIIIRRLLP